jgi:hypothetical protein
MDTGWAQDLGVGDGHGLELKFVVATIAFFKDG